MDSFYKENELPDLGFKTIGRNVKISRKSSIYMANQISIGSNVRIDDFCIISGEVTIGNYVHIAAYSALYGGNHGIEIGDFSNISSKNSIYAISDDYSGDSMTNPMIPDKYKNIVGKKVVIMKHVIVGSGCVIFPGAILGEGSAFGAMSLINKNSEPWSINAGIPFKKIKERTKKVLELEKQFRWEAHKNE